MMGWFDFALLFYFKMLGCGISPNNYTFPCVIKACGGLNNVRLGKLVHQTIQFAGFEFDLFAGSSLIKLYEENGCISDARYLFDKMPHKDCVMWNIMLNGYVKNADSSSALQMFLGMRYSDIRPNSVTFSCSLFVPQKQWLFWGPSFMDLLLGVGWSWILLWLTHCLLCIRNARNCLMHASYLIGCRKLIW